ncbi:MAG: hypothetical protein ACOYI5_11500, partial [Christensenellales bacterium]
MRRALATLWVVCLLLTASAAAQAENLIDNPGFEQTGANDMPQGWYRDMWFAQDGISRLILDEDGYAGMGARVENIAENDARFAQDIAVEPGGYYEIGCMVRAEGIGDGAIGANISVRDTFAYSESVFDTGGAWVPLQLYGQAGADQTSITVMARVGGYGALNTGTAWFDDFYMRKIDEIPAGAASYDFTILSASSGEEQAQASDMPERHTQAWLLAGFGIALL